MAARGISEIAVLVALTVAAGFALLAVPNVELMSLSVFCAGVFLGAGRGALVGGLSMLLFTTLNPYGLAPPPVALAQMLMLAVAGVLGGWEGPWLYTRIRRARGERSLAGFVALGATGSLFAAAYDAAVTVSFAAMMAGSVSGFWAFLVAGSAFSVLHILSNGFIFCVIGWSAVRALLHWKRARQT